MEKKKKPFYKKWWVWLIAVLFLFFVLGSTDDDSEEKHVEEVSADIDEEINDGVYELDIKDEVLGLEITISEIEINDNELLVSMNLMNTTDGTMTFYPDQGSAIIGNKQVESNFFMTSGDVSGDIHGGVEKEGTIKFILRDEGINIEDVTELRFEFGNVGDSDYNYEDYSKVIELE